MAIKKILYPTDFSENTFDSVSYARDMAKALDAQLILFHVIEYMTMTHPYYDIIQESQEDILNKLYDKGREKMTMMLNGVSEPFVIQKIVHGEDAYKEILRYAYNEKIDLIIMATHGYSTVIHSLIGSVTEKVVRKAACPVLTVKSKDFQFEMP